MARADRAPPVTRMNQKDESAAAAARLGYGFARNVPGGALHFFVGKPAAGKTTLARKIASDTGAMLFCEDEWLTRLEAGIDTVEDFRKHSIRLRNALSPVIVDLLRRGISVVLDFPCNGVKDRAWARGLFEAAGAAHVLHLIDRPDDICRAQLARRNETKPEGIYWGHVSEATFERVAPYFQPPSVDEGFNIVRHEAGA
jgi:predicted kinase